MNCRICHRPLFETPLLHYQDMPSVAQNFPKASDLKQDHGVDLIVCQCSGCGLVQLNTDPVPYFRDVIRAAAFSPEMGEFRRKQLSAFLEKHSLIDKKVLEVGCGRGEYLRLLGACGGKAFGIEHCQTSVDDCRKHGLQVSQGFVENPREAIANGPFDAFFIFNFLEHIPDANAFLQGTAHNLSEGAVGLVEVPAFDMILREKMASEFMRDHLYYFTEATLRSTLTINGFDVLSCELVWHDYILSATVRKRPRLSVAEFDAHQEHIKEGLNRYLKEFPNGAVAGWGAGHQALAVLAMAGLKDKIKCVIDAAPFKQNRYTPATHIPIVPPDTLMNDAEIKAVIVMGASYSDEIVGILKEKHRKDLSIAVLRAEGLEVVRLPA